MKISKGTIVRTIMLLIVAINIVLEKIGIDVIKTDRSSILTVVECLIELGTVIAAWWYNNSFSSKALKAQQFFEELQKDQTQG